MTMTDTTPATAQVSDGDVAVSRPPGGLYSWLTTSDHKRIGLMWVAASTSLFAAVTVIGVLLGVERSNADKIDIFGGVNSYFQMWTLYRVALVFLVVVPLFIGIATVVVPMQVGSTNLAFPRAALGAFWVWLIGAGITVAAVFVGGGWGALDGVTVDEADAISLTLVGTGMMIIAIVMASICLATTIVSMRTSGMNLARVPLFAWSILVATSVWMLTLPVALSNLALIYVDLRHGGPFTFGNPEPVSGVTAIWSQLDWLVSQPQVFAWAIPVVGVLGSIIPVAAGVRHINHSVMLGLTAAFGLLSVGGWSQPLFHNGTEQFVFISFGLLIVLPVLGSLAGAAATLAGGEETRFTDTHLVASLGAAVVLLAAVVSGALRVVQPFHLIARSTTTGVFNLVMVAAVLAAVAGLWFWAPKITGHQMSSSIGRLAVLNLLLGGLILGITDVASGFLGTPDLLLAPPSGATADALNLVSAIGAIIVALGALGIVAGLAGALRSGAADAGDDPWDGHSLEWATTSPPAESNFMEPLTRVVSEAPLLDQREYEEEPI